MKSIQETRQSKMHSYEEFTRRPFYIAINKETVRLINNPVKRVADIATGTGAIISQLFEERKLAIDFQIKGFDIDEEALKIGRATFHHYKDRVEFRQALAENIPLPEEWADLTICANAIHLTDAPKAIKEFARITKNNGTLLINTAYARDYAYPEGSETSWGALVGNARISARKNYGITDIAKPAQLLNYTLEDYENMLKKAGFAVEEIQTSVVHMRKEDLKAICNYDEFAKGALPGVELKLAKQLLTDAIKPTLERRGTDNLPRGWIIIKSKRVF